MVYVSNGQVLDNRSQSPWSLSFLTDMFWGAVEFIGLLYVSCVIPLTYTYTGPFDTYFQTLVQPDLSKGGNNRGSRSSGSTDGRGPPDPPGGRRRMGRINHGGGPSAPPAGGGG